ncbi:MAG TPA: nuclear transport factor 2 family protein [Bryobacteraceae bacterium]|nr:nuclear transport factor 2 family protein [Bryobacteraceae bacterium]
MRIRHSVLYPLLAVAIWPATSGFGQSTKKLPAFQPRATTKAVIDEHLDAINHCDWNRLIAQYPQDVEFFLPGGQVVRGRQAVADMFVNIVKPVAQGGLCGLKFTVEHIFQVGDTFNVQWVAIGDALAEPYRGADAYEARNGMMAAQVTTFDPSQMKLKKSTH